MGRHLPTHVSLVTRRAERRGLPEQRYACTCTVAHLLLQLRLASKLEICASGVVVKWYWLLLACYLLLEVCRKGALVPITTTYSCW